MSENPWLPWIVFPLVGALIGYATNWLAVKMLFRPHRPKGFGPLRFQGVVPRRQEALAESIAETVQDELISAEDVAALVVGHDEAVALLGVKELDHAALQL